MENISTITKKVKKLLSIDSNINEILINNNWKKHLTNKYPTVFKNTDCVEIKPREKTLHSSINNIIYIVRLYYRKIRDQGSNFSHETAGLLASSATITQSQFRIY